MEDRFILNNQVVVAEQTSFETLLELELQLKEKSVYEVLVKLTEDNCEHSAILFTGYKNGGYWYLYQNSYDEAISLISKNIFSLKIVKYLTTLN